MSAVLALLSINHLFGTAIPVTVISQALMWLTAVLTVYSGTEYVIKKSLTYQ